MFSALRGSPKKAATRTEVRAAWEGVHRGGAEAIGRQHPGKRWLAMRLEGVMSPAPCAPMLSEGAISPDMISIVRSGKVLSRNLLAQG
jgi:hypothetical protein